MKQIMNKKGQIIVEEVPVVIAGENEVLVQVHYSCISTGTEISGLKSSGEGLYKRTLKQPQNIKKVFEMIKTHGLAKTVAQVKNKFDTVNAIGYSASGVVMNVGGSINDIKQGDRVACAGAGIANHAEFIIVPRNLLVKVPDNLSLDIASTMTIGSIALQGIRRTNPKLGDFIAVIGLGILGQLISQMLKANGCRVVGIDINQKRIDLALSLGMDKGLNVTQDDIVREVINFSDGYGVDSVVIAASTENSEVINQAIEMCRKKGKVVIVGAVGLDIKRDEFYKKELDIFISTSYGPGRYDEKYEQKGKDYPYAYVRWTENRNMQEYLRLLRDEKINIKSLINKVCPIEEAPKIYEELKTVKDKYLIILLKYNDEPVVKRTIIVSNAKFQKNKINVALIGAGEFVKGVHLVNLKKLANLYNIYAIITRKGNNAKILAKQYGASYASTDYKEMLKDKNVDMVVISTRHNLHAQIAMEAAKTDKAVFVEKPMALNQEELKKLCQILEETKVPFMVGFNRRFSSYAGKIKEIIKNRVNPMIINYRMNAGYIPKEHWVHLEEGGGRNIGEACHIYDLFNFFTESEVKEVSAFSINSKTEQYCNNDNFNASIKYKDGSVCNLIYTALGTKKISKEQMDIYVDGKIICLDDYKKIEIYGMKTNKTKTNISQKGHYEELMEFAKSIKESNGYPIPLWQLIQATEISFEVEEKIIKI